MSHSTKAAISEVITADNLLRKKRTRDLSEDAAKRSTQAENSISSIIRKRYHPLGKMAAVHSTARAKMEKVLVKAHSIDSSTNDQMSEGENNLMLEYAQCPTREVHCPVRGELKFRTIDATCNNLNNPLHGASDTAFRRLLPAVYEDGISLPVGYDQQVNGDQFKGPWPSARKVSKEIFTDSPVVSQQMNHLTMTWGQFIDHDLDLFAEFDTPLCEESCDLKKTFPFCYPIQVEPDDNVFGMQGPHKGKCMSLTRSVGTCSESFQKARQQINQITHYLDGSNVYGSSQEIADSLRTFSDGLLKQSGTLQRDLPFDPHSGVAQFVAGDVRVNENVALIIMHTIWVREHNRIVKELSEINHCWNDERLYQEGRKIVSAMIQAITYKEFLPLLFGEEVFNKTLGSYPGYSENIEAIIPNSFASAAFRFGHSLVRPQFSRLDENNNPLSIGPLSLKDSFFNPTQYFLSGGTDPILRGLMQDTTKEVNEFINTVLTTQLFARVNSKVGHDLASRNIQRGREHGIPPYRKFQQFCKDTYGISSDFNDPSKIQKIYGRRGFNKGIDLFVGGMAEKTLPGSNLGPTFACIIGKTFADLRQGDYFYWENPDVFSDSQRASLDNVRLSKVICENSDGITTIIPKALETGQVEQSCQTLPRLQLQLWKDTTC